jgi:predicted MFS family arabinose efflux permease
MRRLSAVLFLRMFAAQAAFLVLGPLLPDLAREFGTTTAAAGQLRTVSGVAGIAAVLSGSMAAAVAWAPPGQRSRVLAWAIVGQPASWVVGMPVVGVVADASWRAAFLVLPLAASVIALAALRTLPSTHAAASVAGEPPSCNRGLLGVVLGTLFLLAALRHAIALGAPAAGVTANNSPWGAKASPEPATRSRTVADTSTSPAPA